ncbi:MAG: FAD-binding protein [Oscillospiraceae bacterium]|nr:FAD-binding protein [Oscillospiraceae bacterium]
MAFSEQTIKTEVLIIGSGIAGSFAALRARALGVDVLVVDQGEAGFVGRSSTGTNVNRVVLPEDDHDEALRGSVLQTDYMLDQEYGAECIEESYDRFQEILAMGGDFERDWSGNIKWMMMETDVAGFRQRQAIWSPFGSYKHLNKFVVAAKAAGARFRSRTLITELLTRDGKCVGAVGIDVRTGMFLTIHAKAVALCSADYHAAGCNNISCTGDGMAMSLRAGAQLRGMEFGRICFGAIWPSYGEQMISANERMARTYRNTNQKVRVINALGEEFCENYEWTRTRPDRMVGGPSWKNYIPAIMKEVREGRGPVFYDTGAMKFEVGFSQRASAQTGGVRIDKQGCTTLPGLFAGGNGSDMCGGMHFSIPFNLLGSCFTGRRAGESAALYAKEQQIEEPEAEQIARFRAEAYAPTERTVGITEAETRCRMIEIWPYLDYRTEETLTTAYERFRALETEASGMKSGNDVHELAKCLKIRNVVQLAQAQCLAARERRESRIEHYRADYPYMDNIHYAKWIVVSGIGEQMQAAPLEIPFERYPYRPKAEIVDRCAPAVKEG